MKWLKASELTESGRYVHCSLENDDKTVEYDIDICGIIRIQMMKMLVDGPELPFAMQRKKNSVDNPLPITQWGGNWRFFGPIPPAE